MVPNAKLAKSQGKHRGFCSAASGTKMNREMNTEMMKFCSGTSPVPWGNLGPSLRNMVPEHPSDLDPCSHLLASVFIADLEKAARGKMRPIFSGQFSWRTTNSNLANETPILLSSLFNSFNTYFTTPTLSFINWPALKRFPRSDISISSDAQ